MIKEHIEFESKKANELTNLLDIQACEALNQGRFFSLDSRRSKKMSINGNERQSYMKFLLYIFGLIGNDLTKRCDVSCNIFFWFISTLLILFFYIERVYSCVNHVQVFLLYSFCFSVGRGCQHQHGSLTLFGCKPMTHLFCLM